MPSLRVLEPSPGDRPSINDDAAKMVDAEGNRLFVYGGTRWRKNADKHSSTLLPTADFWLVDLVLMRWIDINLSIRKARDPRRNPFKKGPFDAEYLRIPKETTTLPLLQDPVGTILKDESHIYILILGDLIDQKTKDDDQPRAPVLICVDFSAKEWVEIPLKRAKHVEGGRSRASMVVTGKIGESSLRLIVFGGVNNYDNNVLSCRRTIAVANLRKGSWVKDPEFVDVPPGIGPFGASPGLVSVWDLQEKREKVLVIQGNIMSDIQARRSIWLFDPIEGDFESVDVEGVQLPMTNVDDFVVQRVSTRPQDINSIFLFAWNKRRIKGSKTYHASTQISVYRMQIRFFERLGSNEGQNMQTQLPSPGPSRAVSLDAPSMHKVIQLEKMSLGRTEKDIDPGVGLFDVPFLIETACVRSKKIQLVDLGSGETADDHETSKILMFGYSPDVRFTGEVTLKMFNAFCMITPKRILERLGTDDEDDEDDLHQEIFGSDTDTDSLTSESRSESEAEESESQSASSSDSDAMSVNDAGNSARLARHESPGQNSGRIQESNTLDRQQPDPYFDPSIANQAEDNMLLSSPQFHGSPSLELSPPIGQAPVLSDENFLTDDFDQFITDDFIVGIAAGSPHDDYEIFDREM